MGLLAERYCGVCSEMNQLVNNYLLNTLQSAEEEQEGELQLSLSAGTRLDHAQKLTDSDLVALCSVLQRSVPVAALHLRYNRLTDEGAKHLADLLVENTHIKSLDLGYNDIETVGAELLAKSLQSSSSLQSLRIAGNKIGRSGGLCLAAVLEINTSLQQLDVSDCHLDTQSVVAFAIALRKNKSVCVIDLSRPILFSHQEETTIHLADMLGVNQHLRELHLGMHGMTDTGLGCICEALKHNNTLRYLDLRSNGITRDGAHSLASLLQDKHTLEILDLSANRVEDDGAEELSKAICNPESSLRALSVISNNIATRGLMALSAAVSDTNTLSHIYIWGNKLHEPVCVAFSNLVISGRLQEDNTDVSPYQVDGHQYLAETWNSLRKHFYCNLDPRGSTESKVVPTLGVL